MVKIEFELDGEALEILESRAIDANPEFSDINETARTILINTLYKMGEPKY